MIELEGKTHISWKQGTEHVSLLAINHVATVVYICMTCIKAYRENWIPFPDMTYRLHITTQVFKGENPICMQQPTSACKHTQLVFALIASKVWH